MKATETYYQRKIAALEAERKFWSAVGDIATRQIDRMLTRCNEGAAEATDPAVVAAYASVLGALDDLTAPTGSAK